MLNVAYLGTYLGPLLRSAVVRSAMLRHDTLCSGNKSLTITHASPPGKKKALVDSPKFYF